MGQQLRTPPCIDTFAKDSHPLRNLIRSRVLSVSSVVGIRVGEDCRDRRVAYMSATSIPTVRPCDEWWQMRRSLRAWLPRLELSQPLRYAAPRLLSAFIQPAAMRDVKTGGVRSRW